MRTVYAVLSAWALSKRSFIPYFLGPVSHYCDVMEWEFVSNFDYLQYLGQRESGRRPALPDDTTWIIDSRAGDGPQYQCVIDTTPSISFRCNFYS